MSKKSKDDFLKKSYNLYLAGLISENKFYDIKEGKAVVIKRNDPLRKAISSIKNYWDKPGHALTEIQGILFDHGYQLAHSGRFNVIDKTPSYTQHFPIMKMSDPQRPEEGGVDIESMLVFGWRWMPNGNKCEITAYLS